MVAVNGHVCCHRRRSGRSPCRSPHREITQADAARKWHVDVSTVIGIRRTVKEAAMAALSAKPGRPVAERNWELERARHKLGEFPEAVKSPGDRAGFAAGKAGWA